ncbi:serine/threonine-protein kinase pelle [Phlebotomus argentipes]|uniref:serine/threonine-protein kinase pelle n=1 Tax=Phlebotomus argentipes TaxID=94469 RepID=UPI0028936BB3|nr:serine/threonine-protein kinase pelle [Phlebotomus argentipes]
MQKRSDKGPRSSVEISHMNLVDMPAQERELLCRILNENDVWKDLAKQLGYKAADLQEIKRKMLIGNSPADELLTMWSDQNHNVTELFFHLDKINQYWAMDAIKNLVDRRYHRMLNSGQPRISVLMGRMDIQDKTAVTEEQKGARKSTNAKILNGPRALVSTENNEEQEGAESSAGVDIKNFSDYASTIPQIDYQELVEATNSWSDKSILGKGGFGTVYQGVWKFTAVAIKKIEYRGTGNAEANKIQMQQSLNELRYLNSCRHDNILPLYGYSINGDEPCLVYQLMTGGSLEQRLFRPLEPLSWSQRINIAKGTARGLQYLHTFKEKPLIHGDIKPANILLDPCCQPRIGDFGLAREGPNAEDNSMEVSRVYGTKPYLPVEFLANRSLSTKVDTFSYGVVLFELVTGLRAYDHKRSHKFLTKHIMSACAENASIDQLIDKTVPADDNTKRACSMIINLGRYCTADRPEDRPEMVKVLSFFNTKICL